MRLDVINIPSVKDTFKCWIITFINKKHFVFNWLNVLNQ